VRLGIFGGSFDPPHVGHLLVAIDAIEALSLNRLLLVPAAQQPLKKSGPIASSARRLAMLSAFADADPRMTIESLELDRGGVSYSVDTVDEIARRFPDWERFLLVGADAAATFAHWRAPERIAEQARIVVLRRGDEGQLDVASIPGDPQVLPTRSVDVSSTEIRERVRLGRTIRGFVPGRVARYIEESGLYR
jgi:nicotinate-nucleotide adenylyltransferase